MKHSKKWPFLLEEEAAKRSDYENEQHNRIAKVKMYHEHPEQYEKFCRQDANNRLSFDNPTGSKGEAYKKASKERAHIKPKETIQTSLF